MPDPVRGLALSMRRTDSEIARELAQIAAETARIARRLDIRGQTVRASQLRVTLGAMREKQAELWGSVDAATRRGIERSRQEAERSAVDIDRVVSRALGDVTASQLRDAWRQQAHAGVQAMVAREDRGVRHALSARVINNRGRSNDLIERRVRAGIARGDSAEDLARDIRGLIRPDVKGGISYAAMRISRTEIANAHHAASIAAQDDVPWVTGFRWNLSRSHPRDDACDGLATRDQGLGPGIYPKGSVPPGKPHPQCLCYLTPEVQSDEAFMRALLSGALDNSGATGAA